MWLEAQRIPSLEEYIRRERVLTERELETCNQLNVVRAEGIKVMESALALCEKEKVVLKDKADTYQTLYNTVKKRPSKIACFFKRVFTLGIGKCN